ncbi:unnamed protein product [Cylindrotheca closterium]|uniref:Uncharacterized protein n=1 Tax=Cylindrotheca closterium TaxID=2856 RepID=A0AAD2CHJ8_9STRA|nr:unnamed protein product [Cylindrotheca closterium]
MLEHSSPKGSSSHEQLGKLLHSFSHYHVDFIPEFGKLGLFQSVAENLSKMMQGYGLKKSTDPGNPNAIVFASAFLNSNGRKLMIENGNNGVIIVQTEQLCCSNWLSEDVFQTLQACEKSDNCVILEYSDHNFQYMKDKWKVSKSVVLLPIMNQGRLDQYYRRHHLPALWERPNDIAFFGTLTEHRNSVLTTIKNPDPTTPEWESIMEQSHDKLRMVKTYLHSKVCLTVHAFPQKGPGEYHRLSELGVSGCVPVMERFEDTLGIQVYKLCGGVVFAAEAEELPDQIASVLEEMEVDEEGQDDSMRRRVEWWKARVKWETILVDAFGPSRKNIEL